VSLSPIAIAVFVKAPYPGQVKTRLAREIGIEPATELYRCFTQDVLATVCATGMDCLIFFSPAHGQQMLQAWLGSGLAYYPQQGGDLGDRMVNAFREGFRLGYGGILLLGSDAPDLPPTILQEAIHGLQQGKSVIGPSRDGGYYAIGFTQQTFCPAVFEEIPWSTGEVYSLTLQRFAQAGYAVNALPLWSDIDVAEDLRAFLQRHPETESASAALTYLKTLTAFAP
jgi:uncharacterized protein